MSTSAFGPDGILPGQASGAPFGEGTAAIMPETRIEDSTIADNVESRSGKYRGRTVGLVAVLSAALGAGLATGAHNLMADRQPENQTNRSITIIEEPDTTETPMPSPTISSIEPSPFASPSMAERSPLPRPPEYILRYGNNKTFAQNLCKKLRYGMLEGDQGQYRQVTWADANLFGYPSFTQLFNSYTLSTGEQDPTADIRCYWEGPVDHTAGDERFGTMIFEVDRWGTTHKHATKVTACSYRLIQDDQERVVWGLTTTGNIEDRGSKPVTTN